MPIDPPPGLPVGFSLLTSGLVGLLIWAGVDPAFGILTFESIYRTPTNFMLLVIPLFILMAHLGLEQMTLRGYRKWLAAGSIAGAGGLAIIIPPSIPAITYAFVMELPILDIFAACLIPGLLMAVGYGTITLIYTRFRPDSAPAGPPAPLLDRLKALLTILPFMGLVVLVLFFGTLMDSLAIILVVLPIMVSGLVPMGFNPLNIGVVFLVNLEMGLTTPPVGMNIFVLAGVSEPYGIGYWDIVKGSIPFLLVDLVVLLLCIGFPGLTLWMPGILR